MQLNYLEVNVSEVNLEIQILDILDLLDSLDVSLDHMLGYQNDDILFD